MINSCRPEKEPGLKLLTSKSLAFPSASAIEYSNGRLFIFGDDANYMLVLDTGYNTIDTIHYLRDSLLRIPKDRKPDIESCFIFTKENSSYLCALGSAATFLRKSIYTFPFDKLRQFSKTVYLDSTNTRAIKEWNIEGSALMNEWIILSNRANKTHTVNKLLLVSNTILKSDSREVFSINRHIDVDLSSVKGVAGISGLYYVKAKDLLLFTASEEDTPNAIDDGIILGSYLGWIENFAKKINDKTIVPDRIMTLSELSKEFLEQKVESVCVAQIDGKKMILHLVADNDDGSSKIFKMRLVL